jgi:hypothetical protein
MKTNVSENEYEYMLGELLAIIHRDGGHHQSDVGTVQAVRDACKGSTDTPRGATSISRMTSRTPRL